MLYSGGLAGPVGNWVRSQPPFRSIRNFLHFAKRLPSGRQGNRIWNVLDISAACCGVKENRFYPHGVEARGWGMGWRHLRRVLKVLKIHGLVTPGGTICLKF